MGWKGLDRWVAVLLLMCAEIWWDVVLKGWLRSKWERSLRSWRELRVMVLIMVEMLMRFWWMVIVVSVGLGLRNLK